MNYEKVHHIALKEGNAQNPVAQARLQEGRA